MHIYKKRSTIDILELVNKVLANNTTHQLILFDFSKGFGNIERDILWGGLYESGLPFNFVRTINMGGEENILIPKRDGYIGKSENNKGSPQGSPISETLFIIYDEQMLKQYRDNLPTNIRNETPPMKIKNQTGENAWTQHLYQAKKQENPAEKH